MASILFKIERIWNSQFKCNYLKNQKLFLKFFVPFLDCTWSFKHFENKKMMVITNVFPKLQTVKNFVTPLCEKRRFVTRFDSQHLRVKYLWNLHESTFWSFYIILREFDLENVSRTVRWNLREFLKKVTAKGKYPIEDWENLQLPIQMQLSEKPKPFSGYFVPFMESTANFKHFEPKRWSW